MNRSVCGGVLSAVVFFAAGVSARAQFKETPPAPYTNEVARQKIHTLVGNADASALSGLLIWYRDLVDDELISAWKGDGRAKLPGLMGALADARVAAAIVEYSWRQDRAGTFTSAYVPMLGDLMSRYPASADPMVHDLLGPAGGGQVPNLSQAEANAVCRILLDMPDTGNWKKLALQILPHYRGTVQNLLAQDIRGNNVEKASRAQFWMNDLKLNVVVADSGRFSSRPAPPPPSASPPPASTLISGRPHIVEQPSGVVASSTLPSASSYVPEPFSPAPYSLPYGGPRAGTLKCAAPVPPGGEYVFHGMPAGNIQIDVDGKPFEARLAPGAGSSQDLILTNKGSGVQKKCTVRWSLMP